MTSGTEAIREALEPVVAALGLTIYDVEHTGTGGRTLRVTVDRAGGVDLDALTAATEAVSRALDAVASLRGPYTLEVSSPGLERALRRPEHFRQAVGSTVSVRFRGPDGAVRRSRGILRDADADGFVLEVDGVAERVSSGDVLQAHTVFEWGPAPKPGRRPARDRAPGTSRSRRSEETVRR
ncbi:MAG: ribosome maturation factor RimP [Acidimicrobiia bacterium]|nr:ribosome maturation factor RimP [Acidimicrobiia bacterium]